MFSLPVILLSHQFCWKFISISVFSKRRATFCFSSASWLQKEQTLTFLDQLTLCCVNVLYVLWDIWQHPWPGGEWGQNHPQLGITGTLCLSIYLLYSHTIFIPISYFMCVYIYIYTRYEPYYRYAR